MNIPAVPSPAQMRAMQQVIINSFELQATNNMPSTIKSALGIIEEAQRLGNIARKNPALTAGVAITNLSVFPKGPGLPLPGTVQTTTEDTPPIPGKTPLGTSIWTNLVITGETYDDPVTGQTINIPNYTIYTCLITLNGGKNLVKTDIQGSRYGTVKEYTGKKDWEIDIKGGIFGLNGQRPVEEIQILKNSLWVPDISLSVKAPIFDEWDITNMVVEDIEIPESMGGYSYQLFEVKACSDINLILNLSGL